MGRITSGLLFAGCLGYFVWAQAPAGQKAPEQASASEQRATEPKAAGQTHPSAEPPVAPSAPGIETTEYPLDKFQDFSAIQNGGPLPGLDSDIHVYRSGNQMRSEGSVAVPTYYVTDLAKRTSASVSAHACLKMGAAYIRAFPFYVPVPGDKYEITPIGEEVVDGHACKIKDMKVRGAKNPVVLEFRLHEAEDLQGFPIKIENRRKGAYPWVIRYKDVRLSPQDRSLFIVPIECESDAGWKKLGAGARPQTATPKKPQVGPGKRP